MTTTNLTTLQDHAAAELARALVTADAERTEHLRAVAEDYVSARAYFYTRDGEPDWAGRSYAYRSWVRDVTSAANVPQSELGTIQAAIRYHIGNVLRERVPQDELTSHGLRAESPRERSIEKREGTSAALRMLTGGGPIATKEEIVAASEAFARALRRVRLDDLPDVERHAAQAALMDLASEAVRRAG